MQALLPKPVLYNPSDDHRWDLNMEDEMTFWPRIMFGDMGTTSGITVIWFDPIKLLDQSIRTTRSILATWSSYVGGNENGQAQEVLRLARGLGGPEGLHVGLERFIVQKIGKEDTFLSSPRIAAKIDFGLFSGIRDWDDVVRRRTVSWQNPSDIKIGPEGDRQLQALNLYKKGPDHINDATKHCLLHLSRLRVGGLSAFKNLYGWNPDWEGN
jgi:hypothetical protein